MAFLSGAAGMQIDNLQVRPPSTGRLFYGLLALTALSLAVASQLDYSQKEFVPGYLQVAGGEVRVVAPARGVVDFTVRPQGRVDKGDPVALIARDDRIARAGSVQQAQRALAAEKAESSSVELRESADALRSRQAALGRQRGFAMESINHAEHEVDTRRRTLTLEERRLERQKSLGDQGMVSAAALDQVRADVLQRAGEVQAAERTLAQARWQVSSLDAELATVSAELASRQGALKREQLDTQRQSLDLEAGSQLQVTAPLPATVTAWAVAQGDAVEPGQLLAKLTPRGAAMEVLLLLTPATVARVKPGQPVLLQLTAFPYQTYGLVQAKIDRIETSSLLADDTSLRGDGVQSGTLVRKAYARITNVPSSMGGLQALQQGMQLRAAVEVERKSFLAWMTWPLLKHLV
jgi:membrane fusion protein